MVSGCRECWRGHRMIHPDTHGNRVELGLGNA